MDEHSLRLSKFGRYENNLVQDTGIVCLRIEYRNPAQRHVLVVNLVYADSMADESIIHRGNGVEYVLGS